jgi:hypothetical protein
MQLKIQIKHSWLGSWTIIFSGCYGNVSLVTMVTMVAMVTIATSKVNAGINSGLQKI